MASMDLESRRLAGLRAFAIDQATARFDLDYPGFKPEETVASICAYEEEGNIGDVLAKMPATIDGQSYTTLVVVDGGSDRTAEIARTFPDVKVIEFPVNLGHGVALQVTYRYCIEHGVKYVVTLDADPPDPGAAPGRPGRLRGGQSPPGRGHDQRHRAQDRRALLFLRHEPHDRGDLDRHVNGVPRPSRDDVGRRDRSIDPGAVPDRGTLDHLFEAGLAGQ